MGNMEARRDWGYAPEYVELMWKMLQAERPVDYVVGTGEQHSVQEFTSAAFAYAGLDWRKYIKTDRRYLRPTEVDELCANPARVNKELGWQPQVKFAELVRIMLDADMRALGIKPIGEGDTLLKKLFPHRWWGPD
jgi:GDPmannose 4,6-dehydratase